RVNATYAPMRKQGAIDLGNGGDNSNGSQGTFYEGAMTAAGTFPTAATEQKVQANVVAAGYGVAPLRLAPAAAAAMPPGLQTFAPGSSQATKVTFTNTAAVPATGVTLSLAVPNPQWRAVVAGTGRASTTVEHAVAPGASVSATFTVTAGRTAFDGDLNAHAAWTINGGKHSASMAEKVRDVSPVRINEFRISSSSPTNSFIELYNAGRQRVDLSGWSVTEHPSQQAVFSRIAIPAGTHLAAGGFYLLGLANSGLAVPAPAGATTIQVRSTTGMSVGDTLHIGSGAQQETRTIARLGTAAGNPTTLWQPLPEGPIITVPAGSNNVPVASVAGFKTGERIGIGYGATYPAVANTVERYEVATVTAVGKPGTQALLGAAAPAGATNIKVNSVNGISAGDKITLDIDSVGHGVETVTVTHVGTAMARSNLVAEAGAGATTVALRGVNGFAVGDRLSIGSPADHSTVTITAVTPAVRSGGRGGFRPGQAGGSIEFRPALQRTYASGAEVLTEGTGLDLAAPLRFNHASNLPFNDRGTGISFQPATAFAHSSDEPVLALGTGVTLDRPLAQSHPIDAVVRDAAVTSAGYQGSRAPNQWFGGPELATTVVRFANFTSTLRQGSIVLRDGSGQVVDSLNYGALVDPWAAEGDQGVSGAGKSGCYAVAPGPGRGGFGGFGAPPAPVDTSAGRFPDGANTDSNCTDFVTQSESTLAAAAQAGATNIKVASVDGFQAGEKIMIGAGRAVEDATIASVGTAGGTTLAQATSAGATELSVANAEGFRPGQTITIDHGARAATATVAGVRRSRFGAPVTITLAASLAQAHAAGAAVAGSGITLSAALARTHAADEPVADGLPTPGAPNRYHVPAR
ncbi:MAG TPA: arabinofuranosidase catalytic domain-containing protein, partial [Terriglobales bacterium]|nr:arabinofuranosidase catalytic domain-containing protein [Terriglobales bacterium]